MTKEAYVEMKIKEKGLKGKAAVVKRDYITRKGFDAFREMRNAAGGKDGKREADKAESEIFVTFLGTKLRVSEEDGGSVAPEEVPRVRGSALCFVGCGGEVSYDDIKRPLKERFSRAPFVKFTKGEDTGLVGFDKALDVEDIAFVKEKIPMLNGNPVTWNQPEGASIHYLSVSNIMNQPINFPPCRRGRIRVCHRAGQRCGKARIGGRGRRHPGRSWWWSYSPRAW